METIAVSTGPQADLDRLAHHNKLIAEGNEPFASRFPTTHSLCEAKKLMPGTGNVAIAGRVVLCRAMGKLLFGHLQDFEAKIQFSLKAATIGRDAIKWFEKTVDLGDHIGVRGTLWRTKKGELTLDAQEVVFLSKALRPHPEKHSGLQDKEACYRQRYLDLAAAGNQDTRERFQAVLRCQRALRRYLEDHDFYEAYTPTLVTVASGAAATPFNSHHKALDIPVSLRIAPETYLKRLLIGGITKVFEFARCFRNEGISHEHLQDFTMIEAYAAYWDYRDNMSFTQDMVREAVLRAIGTLRFEFRGNEIDLEADWPEIDYRERVLEDSGIDFAEHDAESLLAAIREANIDLEHDAPETLGRGNLIDLLYKRVTRPHLIGPLFLTGHPKDVSPLARSNSDNPSQVDRFQTIIGGAELINGYSELADPMVQWERFQEQAAVEAKGDSDAVSAEDDFVEALMYGMPPASGWGLGIERLNMIITNSENIRDVVFFPLMRQKN